MPANAMTHRNHKYGWMAVAAIVALLAPVLHVPAHSCLGGSQHWLSADFSNAHRTYCHGCIFQWLSIGVFAALLATAIASRQLARPAGRALPGFAFPVFAPIGRAPPRVR